MTTPSEQIQLPYGSASDLPSYQELSCQIQGLKLLTRFIARNQHSELLQLEHKLTHLVAVVDRFYDRLGPRNWIFHDSVNISAVEAIPEPPASDFTDELDHAARVTEEAEMDIPSPPFSSCREGIRSRQSLQKNLMLCRGDGRLYAAQLPGAGPVLREL